MKRFWISGGVVLGLALLSLLLLYFSLPRIASKSLDPLIGEVSNMVGRIGGELVTVRGRGTAEHNKENLQTWVNARAVAQWAENHQIKAPTLSTAAEHELGDKAFDYWHRPYCIVFSESKILVLSSGTELRPVDCSANVSDKQLEGMPLNLLIRSEQGRLLVIFRKPSQEPDSLRKSKKQNQR